MNLTPEQLKLLSDYAQSAHESAHKAIQILPKNSPSRDAMLSSLSDVLTIKALLKILELKCN